MTVELKRKIETMLSAAHPPTEHVEQVISGWDDYFFRMYIPPEDEIEEFDDIIKWRVTLGSMSVEAPEWEEWE